MASDLFHLLHAYRFEVTVNSIPIGFKAVKGIKLAAYTFEPLSVGGLNDGPVLLPVPAKESGRLILERGKYNNPLDRLLLRPGMPILEMSVSVYDNNDRCSAVYALESPLVESVELGALDALTSDVLIESFTVAFRRIWEV